MMMMMKARGYRAIRLYYYQITKFQSAMISYQREKVFGINYQTLERIRNLARGASKIRVVLQY